MWSILGLLVILPFSVHCMLGVDVSTSVTASDWSCIYDSDYALGVVRVLKSDGTVDTNAAASITSGIKADMIMYYYASPCYGSSCPNASEQIQSTIQYLKDNGVHVTSIVLDIEGGTWSTNVNNNIDFLQDMVVAMISEQVYPLIYTNSYNWQTIMGNSNEFSPFELWYFNYDNNPNYDDFTAFGGWTRPRMKQYQQNQQVCGLDVNLYYAKIEP